MPDRRKHRGPHPEDASLFGDPQLPALRSASSDLCWLLDHRYALPSALKLVGDRYRLTQRQRVAVARCTCSRAQAARRAAHRVVSTAVAAAEVWIDGYNVLTSVEAALAGGVLLGGRDGCIRDMASMHGSYRKVAETLPALVMIGEQLDEWQVAAAHWLLDRPVSNSGRLKHIMQTLADEHGWNWRVQLAGNPDAELIACDHIVASSDSQILDGCERWINLARATITSRVPQPRLIDLADHHAWHGENDVAACREQSDS